MPSHCYNIIFIIVVTITLYHYCYIFIFIIVIVILISVCKSQPDQCAQKLTNIRKSIQLCNYCRSLSAYVEKKKKLISDSSGASSLKNFRDTFTGLVKTTLLNVTRASRNPTPRQTINPLEKLPFVHSNLSRFLTALLCRAYANGKTFFGRATT